MNKDITRCVLQYVTGESECLCRLCLASTASGGAYVEDMVELDRVYTKETTTYRNMLINIGIQVENTMSYMICVKCTESIISTYLFKKMCQHTDSLWHESLERISKALDMAKDIGPNSQVAYIIMGDREDLLFTSRKKHLQSSKKYSLNKIKDMIKSRKLYQQTKKKFLVICKVCGEKSLCKSDFVKHMKGHSDHKYPCPKCPKVFSSKSQLDGHKERIHQPKRVQCPKCSKMFPSEKILKYHDHFHHTAAICKLCFVQFPSKKDLKQHLDKHDMNKCSKCQKSFLNKQTFKSHLKICGDSQKPQFFCDLCNKGYARKNGLRTHLKIDHGFGNAYTCNWCNKKFDAVSRLKYHIVKHTKEKNFHCEHCNGKFVTQASLMYHVRLHTGERPFPCEWCEETFLSASRRAEHIKRKHIGPTQECTICQSKFITSHQLKKHMERHKNPNSRLYVEGNNGKSNYEQTPQILYY